MLNKMRNDTTDSIRLLASHGIYPYGSAELLKFERNMTQYFEREYMRWRGNDKPPEYYGTSSFIGDIANNETCTRSIEHYNNELNIYRSFLDKEYMCYTMGYYGATDQSPIIDDGISLSQAQKSKFDLIIARAEICNGQNILELGCGFGGFTKYLLNRYPDVHITAINPCRVQLDYVNDSLMVESFSAENARLRLIDKYLDEITADDLKNGEFDRVVSIGVLEAVTNLDKLFKLVSRVLKHGGKTLHHFIASVDTIPRFLKAENTLMANYFPGGHIWPYSEAKRHTNHLALVDSWFINGMNYWKTLDEWHRRFWQSIEELHPGLLSVDSAKSWNDYFVLCKTMFNPNNGRSYGNGQYLYEKY